MFVLAMTADVVTGAWTVELLALTGSLHAGVHDGAASNEQDGSDQHQYERLLLHRTFPLSQPTNNA